MRSFVIIATKGRARELSILLDFLNRQTLRPEYSVIVGTDATDIAGSESHPLIKNGKGSAIISPRVGLTAQRNYGLEALEKMGFFAEEKGDFFCAFFDDDYRMADDWLEYADKRFAANDIVGLTGLVLGDGVRKGGYSEEQARSFLNEKTMPQKHWAPVGHEREVKSVYGCNMAFKDAVIRVTRFDENTPLYAWQEDRDYTGQAKKLGRIIYFPGCRGVHLGTQSGGRTSGLMFGYSQIANPIYFFRKGTIDFRSTAYLLCRPFLSNILRSFFRGGRIDYRGRLRGNFIAIVDFLSFRSDPKRILSL